MIATGKRYIQKRIQEKKNPKRALALSKKLGLKK